MNEIEIALRQEINPGQQEKEIVIVEPQDSECSDEEWERAWALQAEADKKYRSKRGNCPVIFGHF